MPVKIPSPALKDDLSTHRPDLLQEGDTPEKLWTIDPTMHQSVLAKMMQGQTWISLNQEITSAMKGA